MSFLPLFVDNIAWFEINYLQLAGELLDAGVNRSPSAYLNNPAAERSKYKYDVDKEMTLLKFVDDEWGPLGSFNWFATHGTSMSRTNSLISGDNKGAAARFMEDWFERKGSVRMDSVGFENDGIPRRISNIIPSLHDNRKLFAFGYNASIDKLSSFFSITVCSFNSFRIYRFICHVMWVHCSSMFLPCRVKASNVV